jgi:hypothetical protein
VLSRVYIWQGLLVLAFDSTSLQLVLGMSKFQLMFLLRDRFTEDGVLCVCVCVGFSSVCIFFFSFLSLYLLSIPSVYTFSFYIVHMYLYIYLFSLFSGRLMAGLPSSSSTLFPCKIYIYIFLPPTTSLHKAQLGCEILIKATIFFFFGCPRFLVVKMKWLVAGIYRASNSHHIFVNRRAAQYGQRKRGVSSQTP